MFVVIASNCNDYEMTCKGKADSFEEAVEVMAKKIKEYASKSLTGTKHGMNSDMEENYLSIDEKYGYANFEIYGESRYWMQVLEV